MQSLIDSASFVAHGYCLLWQPWLVALYAGSDFLIFVAYALIPFALLRFLRRRPDVRFSRLVGLFAAFILLCGLTHLVSIVTLWFPAYPLHGVLKLVTGGVSMVTAVVLFRLIPALVAIPSPGQLQQANGNLRAEIAAHEATLERLKQASRELETRVETRTAELRTANDRLALVSQETVHRAKNLLAVVGSLARQTARHTPDLEGFLRDFSGRLGALANATAAVLGGESRTSAGLGDVARGQLAPVLSAFPGRLAIGGPAVSLRPEAAQHLALAFHELATNAVKHGALAGDAGQVRLTWWDATGGADGPTIVIEWAEVGGPPPDGGEGRAAGFGTKLLTKAVPMMLGGAAEQTLGNSGLVYRLEVPRSRLAPPDALSPQTPAPRSLPLSGFAQPA